MDCGDWVRIAFTTLHDLGEKPKLFVESKFRSDGRGTGAHASYALRVPCQLAYEFRERSRIVWIGDHTAAAPLYHSRYVAVFGRQRQHRTSGSEDGVELARNHNPFQAAADGDQVHVAGSEHVRNLIGRTERLKADALASVRCPLNLRPYRAIAHKHEAYAIAVQALRRLHDGFPCAVVAQISRMQHDERIAAANFTRDRMLYIRDRLGHAHTVAHYDDAFGIDAFGENALARVFAQDDDSGCSRQRPAV